MFHFKGSLILSKSWLNRAQVVKFFNPEVTLPSLESLIANKNLSDDVESLAYAIDALSKHQTKEFNLGLGGTSFRFFTFLVSRFSGTYTVKGHARLFERPQKTLQHVLKQLGVESYLGDQQLKIISNEWKINSEINIDAALSSQFISGLLLSCWNLENDLHIKVAEPIVSLDYLKMTIKLLRQYGMNISEQVDSNCLKLKISKKQKVLNNTLVPEPDMSSAFSLAAAAVVAGQAEICNWVSDSIQPDYVFLELFKKMNINFAVMQNNFVIAKHNTWNAIHADLNNSPDLFPVLAVLCALAQGESVLYGAAQLRAKESNRILKTQELLQLCGFRCEENPDGLKIWGCSSQKNKTDKIIFNPDHDHRMAMAAAVLKLNGFNIEILTPEVVNKSYPKFWKDIGL